MSDATMPDRLREAERQVTNYCERCEALARERDAAVAALKAYEAQSCDGCVAALPRSHGHGPNCSQCVRSKYVADYFTREVTK